MSREALSKKIRFEVFKRDSFNCQYCGKSAPDVVLHIDHIVPVSKGGSNDIMNLITSCQDCNLGKSNNKLDDNTVVEKRKEQADRLQERREQLRMMIDWQMGLNEIDDMVLEELANLWNTLTPKYELNEKGKARLKAWIRKFEVAEVVDAMKESSSFYIKFSLDDEGELSCSPESWNNAFNKIPGIIVTKRREKDDPNIKQIYYIRGILNNRINYVNDKGYFIIVSEAMRKGVPIENIKEVALECKNWTDFTNMVSELMEGDENGE